MLAAIKQKLAALWQRSQLRALALAHTLPGIALAGAALIADDNVKAALQSLLTPAWFGAAMLASAVLIVVCAPHGEK